MAPTLDPGAGPGPGPVPDPVPDPGRKVQFNVYLPTALVRDVKHRSVDEGTSLSDLVRRALERYLEEER